MNQKVQNLYILVSAQIVNKIGDSRESRDEPVLSRVFREEIDELQRRKYLCRGGHVDEPIIRDVH